MHASLQNNLYKLQAEEQDKRRIKTAAPSLPLPLFPLTFSTPLWPESLSHLSHKSAISRRNYGY